jgi:hypothetical protein
MKHMKQFLAVAIFLFSFSATQAQNGPFIGISSHFVNFETGKYFPGENWQTNWGAKKILVGIPVGERGARSGSR